MALVYGATGSTNLSAISQGILPMSVSLPFAPLLPIGVGLLIVGFGFKVALVEEGNEVESWPETDAISFEMPEEGRELFWPR